MPHHTRLENQGGPIFYANLPVLDLRIVLAEEEVLLCLFVPLASLPPASRGLMDGLKPPADDRTERLLTTETPPRGPTRRFV
jgi:hypothetical protein